MIGRVVGTSGEERAWLIDAEWCVKFSGTKTDLEQQYISKLSSSWKKLDPKGDLARFLLKPMFGPGSSQGGTVSIDVVKELVDKNDISAIAAHLTQVLRDFTRDQATMAIEDVLARLNPTQQSLLMDIASPWLVSDDSIESELARIIFGKIGAQTQQIVSAAVQSPDNQTSFIPRPAQASNPVGGSDKGGIDFRTLPIITQPMPGLQKHIPLMDKPINLTQTLPLDSEWQEIDQMVKRGVMPSYQRIKDYLEESCKTPECQQKVHRVLSCIADILRSEEEEVTPTQPVLREILVLLESGQSAEQLQIALAKIEIPEEEPAEPVEP
ncbi:MAG: hypothetical protein PHY94_07230, partial [Candidatus Omnitrophica bacterium]|nr:hypothetical protein [Candidatus Omnitrophota bacterium]